MRRKCKTKTTHLSQFSALIYAPAPFRREQHWVVFRFYYFDVSREPYFTHNLANVMFFHYLLYFLIFSGFTLLLA